MSNVSKLRAEVMRAHKLAGDKARRIEKSTGARVSGSEYDPRRDASKVAKYNATQLRAYKRELDQFRGRNTQFVAGAGGAPIPKHLWTRYENVQNTYNRLADRALSAVSAVKLPGGSTIGDRETDLSPTKRAALARAANRPMGRIDISASQVVGADALPMLEQRLRGRLAMSSQRKSQRAQRFQLAEMLDAIGESDLVEDFAKLNDDQFSTLWNYTDFPDFLSTRYEAVKKMSLEEQVKTSADIRADIRDQLDWAKKIKTTEVSN